MIGGGFFPSGRSSGGEGGGEAQGVGVREVVEPDTFWETVALQWREWWRVVRLRVRDVVAEVRSWF
jgi:hypothetical protein